MNESVGRVAVITGASSGIGAATAVALSAAGWRVVLGARREAELRSVVDRLEEAGAEAAYRPTDVTKREDVAALVAVAEERFGRLDALVSNAGYGPISPLDDLRVDDWDQMVDVNVKGVLYGIAAALPVFRRQHFGHFVTVASTAGLKTVPNQAVYSGTKFAVRAICEGLRQEAGKDLRVTIISPGFVDTDFAASVPDEALRERILRYRDDVAISPSSVAEAILFALDQASDVDVGEIVIRPTAQS